VFDALRTPRGRGKETGSLYVVRPVDLLAGVMREIARRNGLAGPEIEDVLIGCVTQVGDQGQDIARLAAIEAGYGTGVPGVTLNRFCASGLEAVHQAAARVSAGWADLLVAGGVESMSRVKMGSDGGALWDPATQWSIGSVPQGISADLLATLRGITREEADRFALESQRRAVRARDSGAFDRGVAPVRDANGLVVLERDENPRPETTIEALAALPPAFETLGTAFALDAICRKAYPQVERIEHIHTAGNSSGIVDGAAAVLIGSRECGRRLGLEPRARIRSIAVVGDEPLLMLEGPIPATRLALARARMTLKDVDLFEVNEAFAAVVINWMRAFDVGPDRVNIHGGAIALGHPLGATGAMLLGTLLDALEDRGLAVGLVTLCVGGGMGIAAVLERV